MAGKPTHTADYTFLRPNDYTGSERITREGGLVEADGIQQKSD